MISQRSPHPSERYPWPGENMPLPVRVDGQRVLSAIKLLPVIHQPLHQWLVVTECPGALFSLLRVSYRDGQYRTDDSVGLIASYAEAVTWMIQVAGSCGTPPQLTDSCSS
jgi:hypothetical protein